MAYSELIKNFEKIRAYMQDFYIYGFKTRNEYDRKSARSYDDERRRIESWLEGHVRSAMTPEGKNVYLSIDSRRHRRNPLFQAWKSKSFTDGDITLHFLLLDILNAPEIRLTLTQIIEALDDCLFERDAEMSFDESTVRKKLQEYTRLGIVQAEKQGRQMLYSRMPDTDIAPLTDALDFFSETAPCGAVGSFLLDKLPCHDGPFSFKHHYITQTMDSGILASLFDAIQDKRFVSIRNFGKNTAGQSALQVVPLKIYISVQNGRQYLIGFQESPQRFYALRLDRISDVSKGEICDRFDLHRETLRKAEEHMWGVKLPGEENRLEHMEFDVCIGPEEPHILQRLQREKRCGTVQKLDDTHYRYSADVYDTLEMLPWLRSYICRITRMDFENREAQHRFQSDLREMYRIYDLEGEVAP